MTQLQKQIAKLFLKIMGPHGSAGPVGLRARAWMMRNVPGQLTCAEFERFVHDYYEDALSSRERRLFEFHLELCPMCRAYFASYLQAIELGRGICTADDDSSSAYLPDELVVAILDARRAH